MSLLLVVKIFGDLLLVNLGFALALLISFDGILLSANLQDYWNLAPWISAIALILFYFYGLYIPNRFRWETILSALICAGVMLFLITMWLCFLMHQFAFPSAVYFLATFFQLLSLIFWRRFVWRWSHKRIRQLCLVVVGSADSAYERACQLLVEGTGSYKIIGIVTEKSALSIVPESDIPVLGHYSEIGHILSGTGINGVLFCSDIPLDLRCSMLAAALSKGFSVFVVPNKYEIMIAQAQIGHLAGIPVFSLIDIARRPVGTWKRVMDLILVILFGIPSALLISLAAIAIKLESPSGPVFYIQERVSRGGEIFNLLKLRTMLPDAEKTTGPVLSNRDDHRITRVGKILRWSRIDELPQLWNVLKGEMSFVGPRPERPFFVEEFRNNIPGYDERHQLNAGITGLAQIEGKYSTSPADKLRFDLLYAQSVSPLKDLYILLHTIKAMLIRTK